MYNQTNHVIYKKEMNEKRKVKSKINGYIKTENETNKMQKQKKKYIKTRKNRNA